MDHRLGPMGQEGVVEAVVTGKAKNATEALRSERLAERHERNADIAALQKKVLEGSKLMEREKVVQERWSAMRANVLTNDVSIAESQAMRAFDRWSKDSGVSLSDLKPQWKRPNSEEYQTIECRAEATGSLSSLTKFLYQVEKDPLAMKVEVMDLTTRDTDGRNLTLSLQLSGLVLMPKNNENAAK